jgi:hypothetical protein
VRDVPPVTVKSTGGIMPGWFWILLVVIVVLLLAGVLSFH